MKIRSLLIITRTTMAARVIQLLCMSCNVCLVVQLCFIQVVDCDVPDGVVYTDLHKTAEKGDELVLKCQFYGTPSVVNWKIGGESTKPPNLIKWVEGGSTSGPCVHERSCYMTDEFSLIIRNITVLDQGTYTCRVINYKGILIYNFTEVNVFSPPVEPFPLIDECRGILPNDAEQTCSLPTSDSITITCSASSYFPDIDLFFLHESKKMGATNITEYANMDGTKNKSISTAAEPSEIPYVCVASDIPGLQDQRTMTVTVTLLESSVAMTTSLYQTTLSTSSSGVVATVVVPVIVVILMLAAICVVIILWSRRKQRRNPEKDDPESMPLRPNSKLEETLQRQLRERYVLHNSKIHIRPWNYNDTRPFEDQYISPVISMNKHNPGDGGLARKQLESIDSIFVEDNGTKPKRIICVGAPGSGKSTVLNKLVLDWAKKSGVSSLRKWGVSTLFSLNMGIMSENAVGNTIANQLLKGRAYSGQNIEKYIEANQKNCAILFDGLDERKFRVEDEGAMNNIAQILRGEKYPDCLVIVTTRNNLEDFFASTEMSCMYLSVQIEGFSDRGFKKYIERYFCHSREVRYSEAPLDKSLKDNLQYDTLLRNIISIPFFCMVVCALWEAGRMASVDSLTGLFSKLNMYTLSRFQHERIIPLSIPVTKLFETTRFLGKVALKSMKQNSKVASLPSEDCKEPPILQALRTACDLGLISKKTVLLDDISAHGETSRISYQFYHELALVQCAGAYLASEPEILQAFLDNTITSKEQSMEYETLLRFACGSSTESCLLIMRHILKQWKCKRNYNLHRIMLNLLAEHQGNVDDQTIVDCIKECFGDQTLYLQEISQHAITGLTKFPETSKITKLSVNSFYLSLTATQTMLKHLEHLEEVRIIWASFPSTIPPVLSVRHFSIDYMVNPMSYVKALGFVPCATLVTVGMGFNTRDGVVGAIAEGIAEAAKSVESVAWKELTIDGSAGSEIVSFQTGQELAHGVGYLPHLEVLELCRVDMNEKALIDIVEKCLEITTMKEIRIGLCGSLVDGALDTHLQRLGQVGDGISITVYHSLEYGAKTKRSYHVKHVGPTGPPKSKKKRTPRLERWTSY